MVIVLMSWMCLIGFVVLVGGEINSNIEHAAKSGKDPGSKELPDSHVRVAGHQMGNMLDETTQTVRDWPLASPLGHGHGLYTFPGTRRMLATSQGWHDKQTLDRGLLFLGWLAGAEHLRIEGIFR